MSDDAKRESNREWMADMRARSRTFAPPKRLKWDNTPCPPGPYSEHGLRVEAACVELDAITARLERAMGGR